MKKSNRRKVEREAVSRLKVEQKRIMGWLDNLLPHRGLLITVITSNTNIPPELRNTSNDDEIFGALQKAHALGVHLLYIFNINPYFGPPNPKNRDYWDTQYRMALDREQRLQGAIGVFGLPEPVWYYRPGRPYYRLIQGLKIPESEGSVCEKAVATFQSPVIGEGMPFYNSTELCKEEIAQMWYECRYILKELNHPNADLRIREALERLS